MNKDFKYLLENCREDSVIDGVFTFNTPDGWANVKKKRAVDKAVADNIIEPVTKERIYYRMCNSVTEDCSNSVTEDCSNSIADAELIKENAELKKMVDDLRRKADDLQRKADGLQRKADGLQRAFDAEHKGYLKWRDKYNDLKEEKDRLEILLNR